MVLALMVMAMAAGLLPGPVAAYAEGSTRDKFRASHQADIDLYCTSKCILKDVHRVSKVDISKWEEEQEALYQQEEKLSAEHRLLREMLNQLLNVQHCVEAGQSEERRKYQDKKREQPILC